MMRAFAVFVLVLVACVCAAAERGTAAIPTVEIAPGVYLPMVGLGTWLYNDTVAYKACTIALKMGYPHIDTAFVYGNAQGVGQCISDHLLSSGKPRSSLFVTSKVMTGVPGAGNLTMAELALQNMNDLKLEYVDLLLLHFPCAPTATACVGGAALRQSQWKSIESLVHDGKARAIGVSHYCPHHMQDIFEVMTIKPAVNQVQYHVGMGEAGINATDGPEFDKAYGILYQSFSPLCGPCGPKEKAELLTGPLVTSIGKVHNKTGAQVSLKWQVQQGIPVIPKSSDPVHLAENMDLFGWELTEDDMERLTKASYPPVSGGPGPTDSGDCGIP